MNVQAINELRNFIAACPLRFEMRQPYARPSCGTAGCIAGHASYLWREEVGKSYYEGDTLVWEYDEALLADKLGLTEEEFEELICPEGWRVNANFPKERVLVTLDTLMLTGKIKW